MGLTKVPKGSWICHWHSCYTCLRNATKSGGVQFRCVDCPLAYCFDCFPKHIELKTIDPPPSFVENHKRRGFEISRNSLFFRCNECTLDLKDKLAKIESERKWRELKSQVVKKRILETHRLQRLIAENKVLQETQWREIEKIKVLLEKLHMVCSPSYAATLTPEQQSQNKYHLEVVTKQNYLARENMQRFTSALDTLHSQMNALHMECNAELARVDEEISREREAQEGASGDTETAEASSSTGVAQATE